MRSHTCPGYGVEEDFEARVTLPYQRDVEDLPCQFDGDECYYWRCPGQRGDGVARFRI